MESLQNYIEKDEMINEGFFMNAATKGIMRRMSPKDLYVGILNMYDYIVDNDNIELFYQDFPRKERLFWKNLYDLYQKKVWSIFDVGVDTEKMKEMANNPKENSSGVEGIITKAIPEYNVLKNVTPEFRRELRQLIKQSRNSDLDLKPSDPDSVMKIADDLLKNVYIFTINRTTGFKKIFRPIDAKFLEEIFEKLGQKR